MLFKKEYGFLILLNFTNFKLALYLKKNCSQETIAEYLGFALKITKNPFKYAALNSTF